jgi:MbtH protein
MVREASTTGVLRRKKMSTNAAEDTRVYVVLKNHEEQYSLWLKDNKVPKGWQTVGKEGTKDECLQFVKEVWTDMRPLSLREKTEAA